MKENRFSPEFLKTGYKVTLGLLIAVVLWGIIQSNWLPLLSAVLVVLALLFKNHLNGITLNDYLK